jgi:TRAP-type C4-dicarboxylate transport system substrate-binding protein
MWKRFRDPHSKMRTSSNLKLRLNTSHEKRFKPAMPPAIWLIVCLVWALILDAATGPARAQQQTITVLIEASFQVSARRFLEQLSKNLPEEARDNVRFISTVVPSSEIQARLHLLPSWTMAILSTNTLTNEKVRTTAAGFDMPFIFSNMSSVTALQHSHIGRAGLSTMSEQGMTGLVYLNAGLTLLANRRDPFLTRPTDLKERKVAVFSLAQAEPFKQFGSFPTLSERAKAQGAMESGAVDSVAINSVNASTWVFPARGSLLIDSIKAQVAVVVTQDKSWSEIPFVYRAMMGDAAIAASQSLDRELVEMERPLFDKAKLSGVDLVSFKPEDASRATQQWISVQPVSLRGIYDSVYEYVKKAGSPSPQTPIVPNRRGQTGTLYFATTRDDTNHGNISYRFGDARTNVVKCGQIEFSQNNPSMSTATLVAPVTANTQTCGTILNTALQASERMLFLSMASTIDFPMPPSGP